MVMFLRLLLIFLGIYLVRRWLNSMRTPARRATGDRPQTPGTAGSGPQDEAVYSEQAIEEAEYEELP